MNILSYLRREQLIAAGDRVAVACSGGSDSMVLLHLLHSLRRQLEIEVLALHLEHGIRGRESLEDAALVETYCREQGIPLRLEHTDVPAYCREHRIGIEDGARQVRQAFFRRAVEESFCSKVATAHHREDNAETILFRLLRGCGIRGACGIQPRRGYLIRPLLETSKNEILGYAAEHSVPYRVDSSNADTSYARNFLRHEVLPVIRKKFPEAELSLTRFAENLSPDLRFLDSRAEELLEPDGEAIRVLIPQEEALLRHGLLLALDRLNASDGITQAHLNALCRSLAKNGDRYDLPNNVIAWREYGAIALERQVIPKVLISECALRPGICPVGDLSVLVEEIPNTADPSTLKAAGAVCVDRSKIPSGAVLRFARSGDTFHKLNGGTKKLCDHFTDRKLPSRKRGRIPLLACKSEILAIIPSEIAESVKADDKTNTLLRFTLYQQKTEQGDQ